MCVIYSVCTCVKMVAVGTSDKEDTSGLLSDSVQVVSGVHGFHFRTF